MQGFRPPASGAQASQGPGADAGPHQPQYRHANGRAHAPNLSIASFVEVDFQPTALATGPWVHGAGRQVGRFDHACRQRAGRAITQFDPADELLDGGRFGDAFHQHLIGFSETAAGARDRGLQRAAVGEQQ